MMFDDKSGYDYVRFYFCSFIFFGIEWKGWYFIYIIFLFGWKVSVYIYYIIGMVVISYIRFLGVLCF